MCDGYAAAQLLIDGGKKKMDVDKETVQCVAIIGGVAIAVTALIVDGELGYAMGTGILSLFSGVMGYLFGRGGEPDAEEVQEQDSSA